MTWSRYTSTGEPPEVVIARSRAEDAQRLIEQVAEDKLRQQTLDRFARIEMAIAGIEDKLEALLKLLEEK